MEAFNKQISAAPVWVKLVPLLALPTVGFGLARFLDEYRGWLALGPGGLPYNIRGFLVNLLLTGLLAKRDTKALDVYDKAQKTAPGWNKATEEERMKAKESFLDSLLPQREGTEARALHFTAPQRERNGTDYFDPELKKQYLDAFNDLGEKHGNAIEWKTSVLETRGKAMFLKESYALSSILSRCRREVAHIHESDLTGHVNLSFADAKVVIEKGWGERHRLTGVILPLNYTLLYQPRNAKELEIFLKIFEAGIEYAKSNGTSS